MARKFWLYFSFCAIFLLIGHTANAKDGLFGVGVRFAWENYKTPILIQPASVDTGVDVSAINKTNFGGDFQLKPIDRLAITLALDLGYSKYTVHPYMTGEELAVSASYVSFGFLLGVKFYVIEPAPKKATLYLKLDGGKYIAKASNNASSQTGNEELAFQLAMLGDLSAPLVFQFAVGAEFFAAKSFSVGADILGLRMAYSKGDNGQSDIAGVWSGTQKLMTFSIYSALTLNFGFYKGESSKSSDEEGREDIGAGADGWGASSNGAAAGDGWGSGGAAAGGASGAANADGWGSSTGTAPASAAGGDSWGNSPAPAADPNAAGWNAAPAEGAAAGGWEAAPPPPDDESPVKTNKPKPKAKASGSSGGGGGASAPPPPPPGY